MPQAGQGGIEALRRAVADADRITVLSGAGLSTECGVPDFRSPDSPWRIHKPINFQDFLAHSELRSEAWRRKFAMDDIYGGAAPGRGHKALTKLERDGVVRWIITQNIDGLQQASGFPDDKLIELHGNGTYARCLACGLRYALAQVRTAFEARGALPRCTCGGIVKSGSISFGQAIPPEDLHRAAQAALSCELFLVLGSSLQVRPASRFLDLAQRNGARLAIVNLEPTGFDAAADLVVHEDIGTVLSAL